VNLPEDDPPCKGEWAILGRFLKLPRRRSARPSKDEGRSFPLVLFFRPCDIRGRVLCWQMLLDLSKTRAFRPLHWKAVASRLWSPTRPDLLSVLATVAAALALGAASDRPPEPGCPLGPGFLSSRESERKAEARFLAVPNPEKVHGYLRALTEEPHIAGTPQGLREAESVRDRLKQFGLDSQLVSFDVLLNYPKAVSLKLTVPEQRDLTLRETGYLRDKDSYSPDVFPAFHGYGASGRASGQVVYANYGRKEDFEKLEEMGVAVRGRIVLARYGENFRGLKVREAQQRGAAGVILYSDPADDGYAKGDVYPEGPWRPESAIQRGSVQFLSIGPGDPQTPGRASTKSAVRIPIEKLETIPRIPSLPISYGEAAPVLKSLAGQNAPSGWQGGLPFAYHIGPGPAQIEMAVEMDYAVRPIWNVITTIPGAEEPDRWVVFGNHRDAWTYGAVDPNSGTAVMLEMARGLGEALKAGWKPRRKLILASWDGEEYGLVGSTEWVENLAEELGAKGVAYINVDSAVSGPDFGAAGVPTLRDLIVSVASCLEEPRKGRPLLEIWRSKRQEEWAEQEPLCTDAQAPAFYLNLDPVGSGSDYTAFLDFAGIPVADLHFSGSYGVYHSMFDDLYWMEKFGDPEFLYHTLAAKICGLMAMRLSGAEILPFRFSPYARGMETYLRELQRLVLKRLRAAEASLNKPEKPPINPDFKPLGSAIAAFRTAAEALDAALDRLEAEGRPLDAARRGRINDSLAGVERSFLDPAGLQGRTWFRHLLFAPGLNTGYAPWPFPGIRQAVEEKDPAAFERELPRLVHTLAEATRRLRAAEQAVSGT